MIAGYFCNFYFRRQLYTVPYCCAVFFGASLAAKARDKDGSQVVFGGFFQVAEEFFQGKRMSGFAVTG